MKTTLIVAVIILCCTAMLAADISPLINYQGRLTDAVGAPVSDGTYSVTFSIYASSGAPSPIWTSGAQDVTVAGGLFTYVFGSNVPLPDNIFDNQLRYLGITVGGDPEISPRTQFTAVPYSYRALKADTAETIAYPDKFVSTAGDTMYDDLVFDNDQDGVFEGIFSSSTISANIYLRNNDTTTTRLYGSAYGELDLYHGTNGNRRVALVAGSSGGYLRLYDNGGSEQVELNAGNSGNNSVQLPDDAIDADEILNEPGIVSNTGSGPFLTTSSFVDIATVEITTPGSGYVYVSGHCSVLFTGTTGLSGAYLQIDSTAGGGNLSQDVFVFQNAFPTTETCSENAFVDRVFYISSARTITFRMEGAKYMLSTGNVSIARSRIKAMYFPTSYGSVKTTELAPGDFQDTETIVTDDGLGNTRTEYIVDLRELELKAKEAKIQALEAERELEAAREKLEREKRE